MIKTIKDKIIAILLSVLVLCGMSVILSTNTKSVYAGKALQAVTIYVNADGSGFSETTKTFEIAAFVNETTLTAVVDANSVTLYSNYGESLDLATCLELQSGYKFDYAKYNGTTITDGMSIPISDNIQINVYAKVAGFTITYNTNDGSPVADVTSEKLVFPETSPIKTGCVLLGWYSDDTLQTRVKEGTSLTEDITIYAKWVDGHSCNDYTYDHVLSSEYISPYIETTSVYNGISGEYEDYLYYKLEGGVYYLPTDITLDHDLEFKTKTVICLNGHILNLNGYSISGYDSLEIYDCEEDTLSHNYKVNTNSLWVLTTDSATKTLEALTARPVENDVIAVKGGAITGGYINSGIVKVEKINIVGCTGAIITTNINVINCNFYGCCSINENGSAINGKYINIYNSTFKYNTCWNACGTIYCEGKLLLKGSQMQYNEADKGGAIFADYDSTIITIIDSTISNNTANTNGGGIAFGDGSCLAKGTLITMSDNSTKAIEEIKVGDKVKSLNHETGTYESKKVTYIYKGSSGYYFTLNFEGDTSLKIVEEHDLFCQEDNKYVTITKGNYESFIGKHFYNSSSNSWVELLSVDDDGDYLDYYSIYVENTMNCIANGMLTCPDDMDFVLNMYEFTLTNYLQADLTVLANDITEYGLYSFSDCKLFESETEYNYYNIKYYNIWLGKGLLNERTAEEVFYDAHNYDEYIDGIEGPALVIGKNVTIQNNKVGEKQENVYLPDNINVYVIDGATNINVGITLENIVGDFGVDVYTNDVGFTSDNNKVNVVKTQTESTFTYSLAYIKEQPTKNNDYTVVVNDNLKEDVTYQWYKGNIIELDVWKNNNSDNAEYTSMTKVGGNKVYSSIESSLSIPTFNVYYKQIRINNLSEGDIVTFTIDTNDMGILTESNSSGFTYTLSDNVCTLVANSDGYILLCKLSSTSYEDAEFSLNNIVIKKITKLEDQTSAKLGTITLEDASYYCEVIEDSVVIATSESVKPNKVTFNGGEGATGTAPTSIYQLDGRKITLPANTFTKTGYKFIGWNTSSSATTKLDSYTMGSSDVTLYAIWQEKTVISIDTSLQRFVYDGTDKTAVLKDTNGTAITLNTFSYTYQMYYYSEYGTCLDTKEPGLYQVHITMSENDDYKAVDCYIEFVVTYSLTYKANTGVGEDIIDISDNDTIHKDYFGPHCDDDPDTYYCDAKAILKDNTFTKDNYTFAFWNTNQDGTGTSYKEKELLTLTGNTILYACYSANISVQPTKDNDYSISVATTDSVSFEWEKITKIITPVDLTTLKNVNGNINSGDSTITAVKQGDIYVISISTTATKKLFFYTDDTLLDNVDGVDNTYIYSPKSGKVPYFYISSNSEFTISNIGYYSVGYKAISGETTNSINNANDNSTYRCVITSKFNAVSYSNEITTKAISFNGGEDATGTAPATIFGLEGRKATLPANPFTKTGYKFLGWNTDSSATTAMTTTNNQYVVGNSDVTLYAIWGDLEYSEDIEITIESIKYGKKSSDITMSIDDDDLEISDYELWYYDEQTESYVIVDTITNAGIYKLNVIIKGKTGNYYFKNIEEDIYYYGDVYLAGDIDNYTYTSTNVVAVSCDITKSDISFWGSISSTPVENTVLGISICFSGSLVVYDDNVEDSSVSNLPEDTNYYLEDTPVTISSSVPTRTGYKFLGWNTDDTATTALSFTNNQYTMENSSVTFYAIWQEKTTVVIDETEQEKTYNGQAQAFVLSGTHKDIGSFTIEYYVGDAWTTTAPTNVTSYKVKITRKEDSDYKAYEKEIVGGLLIKAYTVTVVKCEDNFTYNGQDQTSSLTAYYYNESNTKVDLVLVQCLKNGFKFPVAFTDSGEYVVLFKFGTQLEEKNYIHGDGALTKIYHINQKEVSITWESKTYTYNGQEQTIPTATYKDVTSKDVQLAVSMNETIKEAGTYTASASFANSESNYTLPTVVTKEYIVNKAQVNEPTVIGSYKYTGEVQTVTLSGVESYMSTTNTLTQTEVGVYTIKYTLDSNYDWAEGGDGIVTWEIKSVSIAPKNDTPTEQKDEVVVETENGFTSDITVTVEVTVEVEVTSKQLTVDYYNIPKEEAKLKNNEKVGVVFDVKLVRTVDGVESVIQPSDIAPGTKIKVKMLIPDSVDVSKVTRILHVHASDDIEEIAFDPSMIDSNGYYEIEVSSLSEFAFIYEKNNYAWIIILAVILFLLLLFIILFFIWKKEFDDATSKEEKLAQEGKDEKVERKLKFLDCIYRPINKVIFGGKKN